MDLLNELELAKRIAKKAGMFLSNLSEKEVDSNDGKDIKLKADKLTETIIIEEIKKNSKWPILSEEIGECGGVNGADYIWVVDPIDGTYNFLKGLELCCVSIALYKEHDPILGVVYNFNDDKMYYGLTDVGAWCNDEKITVSDVKNIDNASLASGFPIYRSYETEALQEFLEYVQKFKKIRMFGTAALSIAYVACGKVDAYIEEDIMLWDIAAGAAIVKAAGGFVDIKLSKNHKWGRNVKCFASDFEN